MAVHRMNGPIRYVVEENFGGYFNDHDDVSLAEVLQDQEIVYESFQRNGQANTSRTTSNANSQSGSCQDQNLREKSAPRSMHVNTQLAIDEAIAKELQDLENQLVGISFDATNSTHLGKIVYYCTFNSFQGTYAVSVKCRGLFRFPLFLKHLMKYYLCCYYFFYKELQQLGEVIGTESRGLSDDLIERLPKSTYKSGGIFSRKEKHEECVICCMKYESKEKLITLPCNHKYHKSCVTKWLKINKTCPVCSKEWTESTTYIPPFEAPYPLPWYRPIWDGDPNRHILGV
ncbi:E3 ubiquitin ligase BIG BROTHER-related-like isoform X1 [Carex littledalei]|uniref:E3 ubiquitin ligase BIG BROTHER-related-like isoform X1 n=1 Tax=Carex littledalei TaxID=544730 RepID=A0A833QN01_9POAL|nr:E3 ubiquitin ligase BIG BROTHER-related-like isoform X1 [Carex littledalei]